MSADRPDACTRRAGGEKVLPGGIAMAVRIWYTVRRFRLGL